MQFPSLSARNCSLSSLLSSLGLHHVPFLSLQSCHHLLRVYRKTSVDVHVKPIIFFLSPPPPHPRDYIPTRKLKLKLGEVMMIVSLPSPSATTGRPISLCYETQFRCVVILYIVSERIMFSPSHDDDTDHVVSGFN